MVPQKMMPPADSGNGNGISPEAAADVGDTNLRLTLHPMSRTVELPSIVYDTATLPVGGTKLTFFTDRQGPAVDDSSRGEHELVEWLATQPEPRAVLLPVLSLPPETNASFRLTDPFLRTRNSRPGDIDLLLTLAGSPHLSVAIEFKRVRIREGSEDGQRVNRLEGLREAPQQANGLRSLGFSRSYLGVIAVVHDLSDRSLNFASRGVREATFSRLVHFVEDLNLDEGIGILYVEISQPQPESIDRSGVVSAGILRPAERQEQSADLTNLVARFYEDHQDCV